MVAEEVFGPVLVLDEVADDATGLRKINDSGYGLQAGPPTKRTETPRFDRPERWSGAVVTFRVPLLR